MSHLSEKTKVTFTVLVTFLGLTTWLTQIYFQGNANAAAIIEMKQKQEKLEEIATDVAVIKMQVNEIRRKVYKLN